MYEEEKQKIVERHEGELLTHGELGICNLLNLSEEHKSQST